MDKLLWVVDSVRFGDRLRAPIETGVYEIDTETEIVKRKQTFTGYTVRFVKLRRDDPQCECNTDAADDKDIRIVATGVHTPAEAKVLAEADFKRRFVKVQFSTFEKP
ncbi:hypothetical protein HU230_0006300 [Bradyrhizobium quebecense]|uniref:Uncharacterized protein n=1 Tax=Bradyrhizobium quebecense TaxID=2748629 RepID=A0A973WQ94_9BRAD|nr:hypothetical protein [Bradyrhizobium quebecense]UGA45647.1 hypothetical protein HU230_0006300 [Bradyrhizobium quebecense]